jgi:hypothetical protein
MADDRTILSARSAKAHHGRYQSVAKQLYGRFTSPRTIRARLGLTCGSVPSWTGPLPLGFKVCDQELAAVPLARHEFHGDWNGTIRPAA